MLLAMEELMKDLKITLGNLYYALDDEWTGGGSPYESDFIKPICEKYGWSEREIKESASIIV